MGRRAKISKRMKHADFFELAKREKHARTRMRLIALGHIKEGKTQEVVAVALNVARPTVAQWVKRFREQGMAGLKEGHRSGREQKLKHPDEEAFKQALEQLHQQRLGGRIQARDIQVLLKERFAADYTLKGVYGLLQRLKVVWITGRSKHPKADQETQLAFKKTLSSR